MSNPNLLRSKIPHVNWGRGVLRRRSEVVFDYEISGENLE